MNIEVKQIIEERLRQDGFDGLFHQFLDCGCSIENGLAPCDGIHPECEAGYIVWEEENGTDFAIVPKKED